MEANGSRKEADEDEGEEAPIDDTLHSSFRVNARQRMRFKTLKDNKKRKRSLSIKWILRHTLLHTTWSINVTDYYLKKGGTTTN